MFIHFYNIHKINRFCQLFCAFILKKYSRTAFENVKIESVVLNFRILPDFSANER